MSSRTEGVKARTAIAPFTLAGMLTVVCLMILVIFGYVQLFEASSNVSALESRLANLKEQQLMLQSKYDAKIDLTAAEEYAAEIGDQVSPSRSSMSASPGTIRRKFTRSSAQASSEKFWTPCSRAFSASSNICTPQQHKLGQNLPV